MLTFVVTSVADLDPGSGAFLPKDPGSGKNFFRIPDLGSRVPNMTKIKF
jgi:hypothetical protein